MITLKNVEKNIKQKKVLTNISLELSEHHAYLLRGHNGSGKTMLLRALCGLINPTKGTIEKSKNYKYGVIIENPAFFNNETAFNNLKYLANINKEIDDNRINEVLEELNLLNNKDQKVKSFSLGMKQRLAFCQAIMEYPDVLILDEPFNAIDDENVELIINILKRSKEEGKIVVVAAHGFNSEKIELFDQIVNLNNGMIKSIDEVNPRNNMTYN